jgi:ABC-type multidrug transport system ATPase subunit
VIHISDLSVFFGRTVALDRIDLELSPGVIGLFGQNASGKSTLLRILAGLLVPSSGSATWNGARLTSPTE